MTEVVSLSKLSSIPPFGFVELIIKLKPWLTSKLIFPSVTVVLSPLANEPIQLTVDWGVPLADHSKSTLVSVVPPLFCRIAWTGYVPTANGAVGVMMLITVASVPIGVNSYAPISGVIKSLWVPSISIGKLRLRAALFKKIWFVI